MTTTSRITGYTLTALSFLLLFSQVVFARDHTLLNVSYDPTRELHADINKAFAADDKVKTGGTVRILLLDEPAIMDEGGIEQAGRPMI